MIQKRLCYLKSRCINTKKLEKNTTPFICKCFTQNPLLDTGFSKVDKGSFKNVHRPSDTSSVVALESTLNAEDQPGVLKIDECYAYAPTARRENDCVVTAAE